jgi:hypothetical protein
MKAYCGIRSSQEALVGRRFLSIKMNACYLILRP